MWFRDVEFPPALVEEHRAGRLVIFVGAGASLDAPSSLPDFGDLATEIASDAQVEVTKEDRDRPDVLLGRVDDGEVDVHLRVAKRIGAPSSAPNRLHEAVVDLAATAPDVRLVTTNYDLHLSTVLAARDLDVVEYKGPALPMGDDFTGLVYLHGNCRQDPRHLIVTDRDFGRAYLRDAWATRFLERMFTAYSVLFVGYSHSDVVMRYLARGLGRGDGRYVLTSSPDEPDWRRLGIQPVGYDVVDGSRAALPSALEEWAARESMGLLDHRQRIADLVSAPPSQIPDEMSYLEASISDPQRARLFVEFARGEAWLSWVATRPEFARLFGQSAPLSERAWESARILAEWFADHFVMVEELSDVALEVVRESDGPLGPQLWSAVGRHMGDDPRDEWLSPWLVLLVEDHPDAGPPWLEYALDASRWPEDRHDALMLFDHLTEPMAVFQPTYGLGSRPRFWMETRGDAHWLDEVWKGLFVPNLAEAARDVMVIVERHLRRARHLLVASGSAAETWDPVTFSRSAVEPHPQDEMRESTAVLIDAARDCLETLLEAGEDAGISYLEAWADSGIPILQRLAVHGWTQRSDVHSSAKLSWLRQRGWLFDHQLRHEVFRLIEVALPDADLEVADALVADATSGPEDDDGEHRDYERFNALAWIARHRPDLESAQEAMAQQREEHPNFVERDHPDLLSWVETGFVQRQPPMSTEELHASIDTDPATAIAELLEYEGMENLVDGPTWRDAMTLLSKTISSHPEDGVVVLDAEGADNPDIVAAVIDGWANSEIDADVAEAILDRLGQVELSGVADDLSRLLADVGRDESSPAEWHRHPTARELARDLWRTLEPEPLEQGVDDWLSWAINHPAGRIAQFWVKAVAADWKSAGEDWDGLPDGTRTYLEELLAPDDQRSALTEVILASRSHFFFAADRDWWKTNVRPLLDWATPRRAERAWNGFLYWGRWNDQMLTAGLKDHYLTAAQNMDRLRDALRPRLCSHLAGVAVASELDPSWIWTLAATMEPGDRAEWAQHVERALARRPNDAVEHQWQRWIKSYWQDRLESAPVQLADEEASAMATWVVHLTESIAEGVDLATSRSAALDPHGGLLRDLDDAQITRAPTAIAELVAHLLRGTDKPFWACNELARVVATLREARARTTEVTSIVEEAVRLGCRGAADW